MKIPEEFAKEIARFPVVMREAREARERAASGRPAAAILIEAEADDA
jgi:hypothetical protein